MKKLIVFISLNLLIVSLFGQVTDTGDEVGIGKANPILKLDVVESVTSASVALFTFSSTDNPSTTADGIILRNADLSSNSVGGIRFDAYDPGGTPRHFAQIVAGKESGWTAGSQSSYKGYLSFWTRPGGQQKERMRILSNGNVGIGTATPSEKLSINGNLLFENGDADLVFGNNAAHIREVSNSIEFITHASFRFYIDEYQNSTSDMFQVFGNVSEGSTSGALFSIQESGKVAIGTTDFSGNHKLRVEGSIGAREIKVEATGWSDFVFYNAYNLPSLEEVEKFIAQNNHLPEIPSEAEVLEEGINLGEMNAKLLQKIEELTLYLIEQNKELKAQNEEIKSQNERIVSLEKELKNK